MSPVIFYIDDEQRNLAVFEASMPEEWTVKCFDSAIEALKVLKEISPDVIISDQKMPNMTGLEFLEVASQILPDSVRIVVTGQTEESTIIQLIRRAKIFDYITKPWNTEALILQVNQAIDYFKAIKERKAALEQLSTKNAELEKANAELKTITGRLEEAHIREQTLNKEIGEWAPAALVRAIRDNSVTFPVHRDIVGITYDIIGSSAHSGLLVQGRTVKSHVLKLFTEALVKKGGIRESSSGDSVYGHFGALEDQGNPQLAALAAAREFRVGLRSFSEITKVDVECGIALHYAPKTLIQIHEIVVDTPNGRVVQKSFDTDSMHIDLLHRMEKLAHDLPGSNIILTDDFLKRLPEVPAGIVELGSILLKGQPFPAVLYLLPSDRVTSDVLKKFKLFFQLESAERKVA